VVHAFASEKMAARNNVVIAHEMLHTLGASDKYDLSNGQPIFPDGYGDAQQQPLLPQQLAEIMGGRIAISETEVGSFFLPTIFKHCAGRQKIFSPHTKFMT
jgi:hypothetical protein